MKQKAKRLLEDHFGLRINPSIPFGADPLFSIRKLRNWKGGDTIFDVGANDGRSAIQLAKSFEGSRIYSFEPVSSTYEKLVERTRSLENVTCVRKALGSKPGEQEIYLHEKAIFNSFSAEWKPSTGTETVSLTTLDRFMHDEQISMVHLLKIDTEGHELSVLEGAEQALRNSRVAIVQLEAGLNPQVSPHTPLNTLAEHLSERRYFLFGIFDQHHRGAASSSEWSDKEKDAFRPILASYCDAVFIRAEPV